MRCVGSSASKVCEETQTHTKETPKVLKTCLQTPTGQNKNPTGFCRLSGASGIQADRN